ncbi:MAG TPA: tRNA (adenosine(37)-N6)-threonylcarbamoyltransferase complex ATPase subunit type 1 TsaE [Pirellula sp.]|nr:tRNA (adenosine(37)-N6)-threonylcarbamoyltransferase complex ATPase subunit type 1 TsaE [Pirellula sp.]
MTIKILSHDLEKMHCEILIEDLVDCQLFAEQVANLSAAPMAIALTGTLGAGQTQWTRFYAIALGARPTFISSPTFMLVHEYDSQPPIYHLDAYRIGDEDEMLELGIEEMLDADAITIVEWADRFPRLLPRNTLSIHMEVGESPASRQALILAKGQRIEEILRKLFTHWS